jgi:autotransporter strand-loop-strand O-heptosyltransferase
MNIPLTPIGWNPEYGKSTAAPTATRPNYPEASKTLTQEGPGFVRYDFNDGARVFIPHNGKAYRVRMSDLDTGNILFDSEVKSGYVQSVKRYYIRFRVEVWHHGELELSHDYCAKDKNVLIAFPVGTLGDIIGWFSYAVKFQEKHDCKLTVAMSEKIIPLLQGAYPDITFLTHEQVKPDTFYATYNIGLFFDDKDFVLQPCDFRHVGLHRTAAHILNVDPSDVPPKIHIADDTRPIDEPYVCIAVQATTMAKLWLNPTGWREIVLFLKESGYRVICIDQMATYGFGYSYNHIPWGCEDQTGDKPLAERARWIKHADFFVGASSGLTWLAWACNTPVVLISGFTHPTNEFHTPYRVINYHVCNSCWGDVRHRFDHKDYFWCPRHKGTDRQFECSRLITADHVKAVIRTIPGFRGKSEDPPKHLELVERKVMYDALRRSVTLEDREPVERKVWLMHDALRRSVTPADREPEVTALLRKVLRKGDFFIDIGANIGEHTKTALELVGGDGMVWAFEPGLNNLAYLHMFSKLNLFIFDKPLWNKAEEVTFWINADNPGGNALWDPADWPGPENPTCKTHKQPIKMQARTLDSCMNTPKVPRLIKIDTEGAEQKILEGARDLLLDKPPFIIAELHEFGLSKLGGSQMGLRSLMSKYGYNTYILKADGSRPQMVAQDTVIQSNVILNLLFATEDNIAAVWCE